MSNHYLNITDENYPFGGTQAYLRNVLVSRSSTSGLATYFNGRSDGAQLLDGIATEQYRLGVIYADTPAAFLASVYGLSNGPDIFADAFGAMEELTPMSLVSMLKGANPGEQVYADISYTTILDYSKTFLAEHVLYGSSRLGTKNHWQSQYAFEYNNQASAAQNQAFLDGSAFNFRRPWYSYAYNSLISRFYTEPWDNPNYAPAYAQRVIGQKRYELNDHLGNVNAVVTDKLTVAKENTADPLPANAVQHAALHAAYDYYPFGMLMPERYIEDNTAQCTPVTRSQMTRRTIPCTDILFDNPNDELLVQPIGNADVVVTQAVGEIDGSIAVTAAEEESTVGVSVVIPNPCATVTEGVLISMPIENHLDGDLVVQVLQHDPGTNSDVVVASTTVGTAEDVNLTGIAVSSGDFTLEVVSEAGADFVVGALHYMTTEQLSENFVIVECNTDNIYGNDYRFGFNGMQKGNELKGLGNSLDFGARVHDPRLGRWLSPDKVRKGYLSSYQFGKNNPIINIDPDGNTEYYFQGNWVGSDGDKNNNLIGIVKSKQIAKQMKKGEYIFPKELTNGTNGTDAFIIDANILSLSFQVLELSLSEEGKHREYAVTMNKSSNNNGYQKADEGIVEGPIIDLQFEGSSAPHAHGDVDIHSHPTGAELIDGQPYSAPADRPSRQDKLNMDKLEMSIIVGKNGVLGATQEKALDGTISIGLNKDTRPNAINIFDKNDKSNPAISIPKKEAESILTDFEKR